MALPIVQSATATGAQNWIPLNYHAVPFNVSVAVAITGGGSATYTVEFTLDDPAAASPTVFSHSSLASQTANGVSNFAYPVRAARLNVGAISGATVTMTLLQAGIA